MQQEFVVDQEHTHLIRADEMYHLNIELLISIHLEAISTQLILAIKIAIISLPIKTNNIPHKIIILYLLKKITTQLANLFSVHRNLSFQLTKLFSLKASATSRSSAYN